MHALYQPTHTMAMAPNHARRPTITYDALTSWPTSS